jgi:transcriptional regulator with XRE-family HTH domain
MANTKPWKEIRDKYVSPERQRRNAAAAARTIMGLQKLRRARYLTQTQLATAMEMTQPELSKLEHRADLYVSTLRRFVEAMGGTLEITARFSDGETEIIDLASADSEFGFEEAVAKTG